jgi:hypothetical protein
LHFMQPITLVLQMFNSRFLEGSFEVSLAGCGRVIVL